MVILMVLICSNEGKDGAGKRGDFDSCALLVGWFCKEVYI